jgi:hypothetical protein
MFSYITVHNWNLTNRKYDGLFTRAISSMAMHLSITDSHVTQVLFGWRSFATDPKMVVLQPAIEVGIESLEKYYNQTDNSPVYIVSMCECRSMFCAPSLITCRPKSMYQGRVLQGSMVRRRSKTSACHDGASCQYQYIFIIVCVSVLTQT